MILVLTMLYSGTNNSVAGVSSVSIDSLIHVLDKEISNTTYQESREKRIAGVRAQLASAQKPAERLMFYDDLIGYYNNYQSDSLLIYLERSINLA